MKATDTQVGGDHYKAFKIQPIEFIEKNGLGFAMGNVVKYVCRAENKNGREDLLKAKHYLDLLIQFHYPEGEKKLPGVAGNFASLPDFSGKDIEAETPQVPPVPRHYYRPLFIALKNMVQGLKEHRMAGGLPMRKVFLTNDWLEVFREEIRHDPDAHRNPEIPTNELCGLRVYKLEEDPTLPHTATIRVE